MARKFLYIVAGLVVLVLVVMLALRIFASDLTEIAFVPSSEFKAPPPLKQNAYDDPAMWIARPGLGEKDPARWLPSGMERPAHSLGAAVFFVHPTSFFEKSQWNAPIDDEGARKQAERFVQQMASPFNLSADLWSPRYRQATLGAFVTDSPDADKALATAYTDVEQAFAYFVQTVDKDRPIILAGHSQGAYHLARLIRDHVKGTPLQDRIAAAYVVGWPVSLKHDLVELGLPACTSPEQHGCVISWLSWAEPAEPESILENYAKRGWLDGAKTDGRPFLCSNPLAGMTGKDAPASENLGTLVRDEDTPVGFKLVEAMIPARCGADGFLLIGPPPDLGKWVMPGNNYHVYDIPMFWRNLRADVARRVESWKQDR